MAHVWVIEYKDENDKRWFVNTWLYQRTLARERMDFLKRHAIRAEISRRFRIRKYIRED